MNNAFAMDAPYNIMVYGMGDGQIMNPVVGQYALFSELLLR
jgi:hypothetical protein